MPMTHLEAVTFDFWSTLVDGRTTPERTARRMARLQGCLGESGFPCEVDDLRAAFRRAGAVIRARGEESLEELGPAGRWALIAHELGVPDGQIPFAVVEKAYEDITLDPLPDLMPHVDVAVRALAAAGYRLGVICNTGMAGGRTLRVVLDRYGLLDCFHTTTWSDEFGWSKPDPRIFHHTLDALGVSPAAALHVGDLEELDVEGARRAGMWSAHYVPDGPHAPSERADLLVRDWQTFPHQVAVLAMGVAQGAGRAQPPTK